MRATITAFEQSPDGGQGLARDMPVRWAFEEVGQPYDVRLVSFSAIKEGIHRKLQPFGQIPTYEKGDLVLFESGAIVLHIAEGHTGLLPNEANARARAITWMFAALSTVEPVIVQREVSMYSESGQVWHEERLRIVENRIRNHLKILSARLGDNEWLDGTFSAGDLLMIQVLRRLGGSDILEGYSNLVAYVSRGEARPAFRRAFEDQLSVSTGGVPSQSDSDCLKTSK